MTSQVCFYYAPNGKLGDQASTSRRTEVITQRLVSRGFMIDYAPGGRGKFFRVVINISTEEATVKRLVGLILDTGKEVVAAEDKGR